VTAATAKPTTDQLITELLEAAHAETLTEARYDEIINALEAAGHPDHSMATLVTFGEPAWREKHTGAPQPV
jgi:hypothetical protein